MGIKVESLGNLMGGAMRVVGQAAAGEAVAQSDAEGTVSGRVNVDLDAMKEEAREATGGTGEQATADRGDSSAGASAQTSQTATRATSAAAWWSFLMLLLGMGAAALGGAQRRYYTIGRRTFDEAPAS